MTAPVIYSIAVTSPITPCRAAAPCFTEGFVKAYAKLVKGDVKCRFPMQS
jgi:hypothetical protein